MDIQSIKSGKNNGQIVWICDLRYNDYSNKPIRHIKPTRVLIRSNSEINKTIYYSDSHFVALNNKDEIVKSKVFSLYDNTGFRSFTGVALQVFETEQECMDAYRKQCDVAIAGLTEYKITEIQKIDNKINELL